MVNSITDGNNANENTGAVEPRPSPTVFLSDPDVTLWHGDVRDTLAQLEAGSVDCVVTSPPYWGLRDYGTGAWEGGEGIDCPDCHTREEQLRCKTCLGTGEIACAHSVGGQVQDNKAPGAITLGQRPGVDASTCRKCGATRIDQQLGLEPTPELYIENMVAVFREVWRVLADHGTCWMNMGDSYGDGKQLVMMPARLALALQADGWILRSDIVWSKANPMPESVTDRPTKSHEYVFLLAKRPRYFFDQEAVREPHHHDGRTVTQVIGQNGSIQHRDGERWPNAGRNIRSVWEIATQPYPEAHFATFPEELARRCILAGCPEWVCGVCGKPRERIMERGESDYARLKREEGHDWRAMDGEGLARGVIVQSGEGGQTRRMNGTVPSLHRASSETVGWSDCGHGQYRPGRVLDPFVGSGTVPHVARKHGRHAIGIDLNGDYLELAGRRLQQLSLLSEVNQ